MASAGSTGSAGSGSASAALLGSGPPSAPRGPSRPGRLELCASQQGRRRNTKSVRESKERAHPQVQLGTFDALNEARLEARLGRQGFLRQAEELPHAPNVRGDVLEVGLESLSHRLAGIAVLVP
jgi:hypothetical protein